MYGENYIERSLSMIKSGPYNIDLITDTLCDQICSDYGIKKTDELKEKIEELLINYKDNKINESTFVRSVANVVDTTIIADNAAYVENQKNGNFEATKGYTYNTNATYDICPEDIVSLAGICSSISSILDGAEITVPALVAKYAAKVVTAAKGAKLVSACVGDFNKVINEVIRESEENDVLFVSDLSWDEIMEKYSSDQNSKPLELTAEYIIEHAKELGVEIIDPSDYDKIGITYEPAKPEENETVRTKTLADLVDKKSGSQFAHMNIEGKDCYYDMITHNFYVDGYDPHIEKGKRLVRGCMDDNNSNPLNATIYLPSGATDYSHLNTYTYFVSTDRDYETHLTEGTNGKLDENGKPDRGQATNSVLIQVRKNTANDGAWDKHDETGYMTKFVNSMFKTETSNGRCRNIIGGDSKYGAISMVVAAQNDDLYDTVYCVDNAVIVSDLHVKSPDSKTQITADEVLKLKGKDLYFITVYNDENLNHGAKNGGDWVKLSDGELENSHFMKGLKYLCTTLSEDDPENKSGTNVHVIYTPHMTGVEKNPEKTLEKGTDKYGRKMEKLCDECKDLSVSFTYHDGRIDNLWGGLFSKFWTTHTEGNYIPTDLSSAPMTNYNYYSSLNN